MKIGVLNELLTNVSWNLTFADTKLVPCASKEGNPLSGDSILLRWDEIRDAGVEVHVGLGKLCFVDCVVIKLGEKTKLTSATLKNQSGILYQHCAETGKIISSDTVELEAGVMTDAVSLVLTSEFSDLEILSVEIFGAVEDEADLFPTPDQVAYYEEVVEPKKFTCYRGVCKDSMRAGEILAEKFLEITGVVLNAVEAEAEGTVSDCISQGCIDFVADSSICADGYELEITREGAKIAASNFRGFVCGAECFIKLTETAGVRACRISDKPRVPFRGVHLFIPAAH